MTYDEIVAAGKASLGPNEFWCIEHPDGPLTDTASKDFAASVRLICDALSADWDDLRDQGFRLGRVTLPLGADGPTGTADDALPGTADDWRRAASAMEARSAETEGLGPKGDSAAAPQGAETPNPHRADVTST